MLLRSNGNALASTSKLIPQLIIRNQSTLTSTNTFSNTTSTTSDIPLRHQINFLKAAVFGLIPLSSTEPSPFNSDYYQSSHISQGFKETKRRGYESLNRVERSELSLSKWDGSGGLRKRRKSSLRYDGSRGRKSFSTSSIDRSNTPATPDWTKAFDQLASDDKSSRPFCPRDKKEGDETGVLDHLLRLFPKEAKPAAKPLAKPKRKDKNPASIFCETILDVMDANKLRPKSGTKPVAKPVVKLKSKVNSADTREDGNPKAGDWIEVRIKGGVSSGLYLGKSNLDATRSIMLSSTINLSTVQLNDITFILPSLVKPSVALAAYTPYLNMRSESSLTDETLRTPESDVASYQISQEMRKLETRVEEAKIDLVELGIGALYGALTSTEDATKTLTTAKALSRVYFPQPPPGTVNGFNPSPAFSELSKQRMSSVPTPSSLLLPKFTLQIYHIATHQILMEDPLHFICDPLSHRTSSMFTLRPRQELISFELVRNWVRTRSIELAEFCEKCVSVAKLGETFQTKNEIVKGKEEGLKICTISKEFNWNQNDLEIIGFLRLSLTSQRLLQLQPYLAIVPGIIKLIEEVERRSLPDFNTPSTESISITSTDLDQSSSTTSSTPTRTDVFDRERVMNVLISIGIVPIWENWAAHSYTKLATRSNLPIPLPISSPTPTPLVPFKTFLPQLTKEEILERTYNKLPKYKDGLESVRKDFGSMKVYTIDDPGAMELDDGISIEEWIQPPGTEVEERRSWWIHVHVADPTSVLSPQHEISQLAKDRYQTIYLPEKTFPMLPEWFIKKEKLSLGAAVKGEGEEGGNQNVLTFSTRVNLKGVTLESEVRAGIVRDVRRLTYAAVDDVLGHIRGKKSVTLSLSPSTTSTSTDESSPSISSVDQHRQTDDSTLLSDPSAVADLKHLFLLSNAVLKMRAQRALYWNYPSCSATVSPNLSHQFTTNPSPTFYSNHPSITLTLPNPEETIGKLTPSQTIVSEFMVLANRTAARFCAEKNLPVSFRSQVAPQQTKPSSLQTVLSLRDPDTGLVRGEDVLKYDINFEAAITTPYPLPHWPMGIHDKFGYLKVTSPLRRYSDMICHWQIKSALLPTTSPATSLGPPFSSTAITTSARQFESVDRQQKTLDRSGNSFWAHYLLKSKMALETGVDPVADKIFENLSCLGLRPPVFSLDKGFWSQRVLIMELGIRAQLDLGMSSSDAAGVGETIPCRIREIVLSENSRCWVTLK